MKDFLNGIKTLLTGKRSISGISAEEIRKERIRLEQAEGRITSEIEQLETKKKELFSKGASESSQRSQVMLARKIKELDAQAKARDGQLAMISRQSRILAGLSMIKENESMMCEMGVSSIISKMDLPELERYIEKASVTGEFQMERFGQILQILEGPAGASVCVDEDEDTLAIVAAMQQAQADGDGQAVESGMTEVQNILQTPDLDADSAV